MTGRTNLLRSQHKEKEKTGKCGFFRRRKGEITSTQGLVIDSQR
jgi:hypothetical protein